MLPKGLAVRNKPVQIAANDKLQTGSTGGMNMTSAAATAGDRAGLLDRQRIIAPDGYNRWLVPPAALAIHLCIGMAYGFSVFWVPLGRAVVAAQGLDKPIACPGDATTFWGKVAITRPCAVRHGLRLDPVRSRLDVHPVLRAARRFRGHLGRLARARRPPQGGGCRCDLLGGGFLISAFGVYIHQLWLMWLGLGHDRRRAVSASAISRRSPP